MSWLKIYSTDQGKHMLQSLQSLTRIEVQPNKIRHTSNQQYRCLKTLKPQKQDRSGLVAYLA